MSNFRISKFSDPARGGRRVEIRILGTRTTVLYPEGIRKETTAEYWKDVGTLQEKVTNHVKEQPTNKWKQALIDRAREARMPEGWAHAGPAA